MKGRPAEKIAKCTYDGPPHRLGGQYAVREASRALGGGGGGGGGGAGGGGGGGGSGGVVR